MADQGAFMNFGYAEKEKGMLKASWVLICMD